jgi:hypothetical protein
MNKWCFFYRISFYFDWNFKQGINQNQAHKKSKSKLLVYAFYSKEPEVYIYIISRIFCFFFQFLGNNLNRWWRSGGRGCRISKCSSSCSTSCSTIIRSCNGTRICGSCYCCCRCYGIPKRICDKTGVTRIRCRWCVRVPWIASVADETRIGLWRWYSRVFCWTKINVSLVL